MTRCNPIQSCMQSYLSVILLYFILSVSCFSFYSLSLSFSLSSLFPTKKNIGPKVNSSSTVQDDTLSISLTLIGRSLTSPILPIGHSKCDIILTRKCPPCRWLPLLTRTMIDNLAARWRSCAVDARSEPLKRKWFLKLGSRNNYGVVDSKSMAFVQNIFMSLYQILR